MRKSGEIPRAAVLGTEREGEYLTSPRGLSGSSSFPPFCTRVVVVVVLYCVVASDRFLWKFIITADTHEILITIMRRYTRAKIIARAKPFIRIRHSSPPYESSHAQFVSAETRTRKLPLLRFHYTFFIALATRAKGQRDDVSPISSVRFQNNVLATWPESAVTALRRPKGREHRKLIPILYRVFCSSSLPANILRTAHDD